MRRILACVSVVLVIISLSGCIFPGPYDHGGGYHGYGHPHYYWR